MNYQLSDFPSDLMTFAGGLNCSITAMNSTTKAIVSWTWDQFMNADLTNMILLTLSLPFGTQYQVYRAHKVMFRHALSHSIVNAAFNITVNNLDDNIVQSASIVYGNRYYSGYGINDDIGNIGQQTQGMTNTQAYLIGKSLLNPATLSGALAVLAAEAIPHPDSGQYNTVVRMNSSIMYDD